MKHFKRMAFVALLVFSLGLTWIVAAEPVNEHPGVWKEAQALEQNNINYENTPESTGFFGHMRNWMVRHGQGHVHGRCHNRISASYRHRVSPHIYP